MMTVLQLLLIAVLVLMIIGVTALLVIFWAADATAAWEHHKLEEEQAEDFSNRVDKRSNRLAHNQQNAGSNPAPVTLSMTPQEP